MSVVESDYLKRWVGVPITEALTEVALKRPADPIEYIALWLLKYKENQLKKSEVNFKALSLSEYFIQNIRQKIYAHFTI